jgi:hypothetical protein
VIAALRRPAVRTASAALLLAVVFFALRVWLARTPFLSETYYDEALTGLMGLAVLRGVPQVFYWGQPYLGAIDAYLAAAGFWLAGPSTFVLRMAAAGEALLWTWAVWDMGRRAGGPVVGLLAGLLVAAPPVFLSFVQLSATGQSVAVTLGVVTLAAAVCLVDPRATPRARRWAWITLGLAGGLGWWGSQTIVMFLAAAVLGVLVARPRLFREPGLYAAVGLFAAGSLPFWAWNLRHEWATFWHLATWGDPLPEGFLVRVRIVAGLLLDSLLGGFWDGRSVTLPRLVPVAGWIGVVAVYLPAVTLAAWQLGVWAVRLARRRRPWQEPLDLVVLAFWLTGAAHVLTWFGTAGVVRYSMTFYGTLPVLGAVWLGRLWRLGPVGRVAAPVIALLVLGFNLATHVAFVAAARGAPARPVDAALAALERLGIDACYADSRIAQVLTFESAERIRCADYYGLRNLGALAAVDAVETPDRVAIVTHRVLESPSPAEMAALFGALGASARRTQVGDYMIFHHAAPLIPQLRPIPRAGWTATASSSPAAAGQALDGRVWTRWRSARSAEQWIQVDLGGVYPLAELVLESEPTATAGTVSLRVETSPDGHVWDEGRRVRQLLTGAHWWKGHPRLDETGRVVLRMPPRPARYVRVVSSDPAGLGISELFAAEVTAETWRPPPPAQAALDEAARGLAHWADDPTGPHPRRAPVTLVHRQGQVPWATVFAGIDRAIRLAPDWTEPQHLYAQALARWGWNPLRLDLAVERARHDQAWGEVLRWAAAAAESRPGLWRSGRDEARIEALEQLGEPAAAAQARADLSAAAAARRPVRPREAWFADLLQLTGVDLPDRARPGERIPVRYTWRLSRPAGQDYGGLLRFDGARRQFSHDFVLGGRYPTGSWREGEQVQETLAVTVPADTPAGAYDVTLGVRLASTGRALAVSRTTLPVHHRHIVVVGRLIVEP